MLQNSAQIILLCENFQNYLSQSKLNLTHFFAFSASSSFCKSPLGCLKSFPTNIHVQELMGVLLFSN